MDTEIQAQRTIWREAANSSGYDQRVGTNKRGGDTGRTCHAGSHPPVSVDTAEIFGSAYNRVAERKECIGGNEFWNKKQPDGARTNILGTRILCQHSRIGRRNDTRIHKKSRTGRQASGRIWILIKTKNVVGGETPHSGGPPIPPVHWWYSL